MSEEKRLYDLAEERKSVKKNVDPMDEAIEAEDRELAREAKRLRLQEIVEDRKRRIEKLKGEEASGQGSGGEAESLVKALLTDPKAQKQWLSLDEDQRNVILASVSAIMTSQGGNVQGMGLALPLMMMQARQNPATSIKDMVELIKTVSPTPQGDTSKSIVEAVRLGVEIAGKGKGEGGRSPIYEAMEFLKPLYEGLSQKDKELMLTEIRHLQDQIQPLDQQVEHYTKMAEALGLRRGGENAGLETARLDLEKWKAEQTFAMQKWQMEQGLLDKREARKWATVKGIVQPMLKKATPIIDAATEEAEKGIKGIGERRGGTQVNVQEGASSVPCPKCQTRIPVQLSPTGEYPPALICPNCGNTLTKEA